ncbi:uncharacterized protein AB675_10048 [Cyphellophora attinorum]|uniref:Uncharacterized protein n=1 Tax=Cyphellophora attinorum TaxID=1664694 RepID=A0A0N1NYA4_9EURO|nr:uncharacterized protein AB675_10048 [Phialophora attinorum]KPI36667.1 hypothetical protein AB675_10048 [Phialophora attinorum]
MDFQAREFAKPTSRKSFVEHTTQESQMPQSFREYTSPLPSNDLKSPKHVSRASFITSMPPPALPASSSVNQPRMSSAIPVSARRSFKEPPPKLGSGQHSTLSLSLPTEPAGPPVGTWNFGDQYEAQDGQEHLRDMPQEATQPIPYVPFPGYRPDFVDQYTGQPLASPYVASVDLQNIIKQSVREYAENQTPRTLPTQAIPDTQMKELLEAIRNVGHKVTETLSEQQQLSKDLAHLKGLVSDHIAIEKEGSPDTSLDLNTSSSDQIKQVLNDDKLVARLSAAMKETLASHGAQHKEPDQGPRLIPESVEDLWQQDQKIASEVNSLRKGAVSDIEALTDKMAELETNSIEPPSDKVASLEKEQVEIPDQRPVSLEPEVVETLTEKLVSLETNLGNTFAKELSSFQTEVINNYIDLSRRVDKWEDSLFKASDQLVQGAARTFAENIRVFTRETVDAAGAMVTEDARKKITEYEFNVSNDFEALRTNIQELLVSFQNSNSSVTEAVKSLNTQTQSIRDSTPVLTTAVTEVRDTAKQILEYRKQIDIWLHSQRADLNSGVSDLATCRIKLKAVLNGIITPSALVTQDMARTWIKDSADSTSTFLAQSLPHTKFHESEQHLGSLLGLHKQYTTFVEQNAAMVRRMDQLESAFETKDAHTKASLAALCNQLRRGVGFNVAAAMRGIASTIRAALPPQAPLIARMNRLEAGIGAKDDNMKAEVATLKAELKSDLRDMITNAVDLIVTRMTAPPPLASDEMFTATNDSTQTMQVSAGEGPSTYSNSQTHGGSVQTAVPAQVLPNSNIDAQMPDADARKPWAEIEMKVGVYRSGQPRVDVVSTVAECRTLAKLMKVVSTRMKNGTPDSARVKLRGAVADEVVEITLPADTGGDKKYAAWVNETVHCQQWNTGEMNVLVDLTQLSLKA